MKRLRGRLSFKITIWLLLLLITFSATAGIQYIAWSTRYMDVTHWQDSGEFFVALTSRRQSVIESLLTGASLEADDLDYAHRKELEKVQRQLVSAFSPENTNFRYEVRTVQDKVLFTNLEADENLEQFAHELHYYMLEGTMVQTDTVPTSNSDVLREETTLEIVETYPEVVLVYGVAGTVDGLVVADEFTEIYEDYHNYAGISESGLQSYFMVLILAGLGALLCVALLLWSAGYKKGEEKATPIWQDNIWIELVIVIAGVLLAIVMSVSDTYLYRLYGDYYPTEEITVLFLIVALMLTVVIVLFTAVLRTLVVRIRCGTLLRSSGICCVFRWVFGKGVNLVEMIPIIWRTIFLFCTYVFLRFFVREAFDYIYPLSVFAVDFIALALVVRWTIAFRRVRDGSEAISEGNLSHQINTEKLPIGLKNHANSINNISIGMAAAVDSRIKSERFKAELITNVSHDLKTPLTSIINYVDLLKTTEQTDPRAEEYIEVLERKAQRLKKLTEDLVEASKASTGALKVNREKIGMEQLLDQAIGEYKEKLEARHLTLVTTLPEGESCVYADGRHLWRVIDNLLSNCAKYAMEGTRVYLELTRGHGQVILSVKNISKEPQLLSSEQLQERFVRGDEARTTEGSGLGLSIARSLTELQGGSFELVVDGDLFKAVITLAQAT